MHTDEPGRALELATAIGVVEAVEVANMHRQTAEREVRLLEGGTDGTAATAVVAVSVGDGNRLLFERSGATVVDGGETMNPSTEALLQAIESAPAAEVVVLPNNPNVFMAADEAASLATKPVRVVRSESIQEGLTAIVAHEPARDGRGRRGRDGRGPGRCRGRGGDGGLAGGPRPGRAGGLPRAGRA